ncbi:MAG: glycosyltransferase family 1 protein, partial [Candidatus Margulisbacteria bacterium]|nr:glycosyltransferase family 1 protein [Candidatus Margulisiibacteriota bacterium]
LDKAATNTPYLHEDIIAAFVVSDDSRDYLRYVFPQLRIFRLHNGIDAGLFSYTPNKKQQIAFMPRKNIEDIRQVVNILKFRNIIGEYDLVPIEDKKPKEVAGILKESLIFLSFGYPEGFSLPPAEAMSCGCILIGYHGMGGKEYFNNEYCYPVNQGDIIQFAQTIETVIGIHKGNPRALEEKGRQAAIFIKNNYSLAREEDDILRAWRAIIHHD